jgi:hypothetical protein
MYGFGKDQLFGLPCGFSSQSAAVDEKASQSQRGSSLGWLSSVRYFQGLALHY